MDQLDDTPPLPERHTKAYVVRDDGSHAVVCNVPQDAGSADEPCYVDAYYVHTSGGTTPCTEDQILDWWHTVTRWAPNESEKTHLGMVASDEMSWAQALTTIDMMADSADAAEVVAHE